MYYSNDIKPENSGGFGRAGRRYRRGFRRPMADVYQIPAKKRVLRILGLLLTVAGLVVLTSLLAFAGVWSYISVPGGLEVPMVVLGPCLIALGFLLAWAGRRSRVVKAVEKIDVKPIAEWVRAFEKHQAELEFHRLSDLYHGQSLIKFQPRTLTSRHEPAA